MKKSYQRQPSSPLRLLAWEITRRCRYKCRHCRGGAEDKVYPGELTTTEARRVLENLANFSKPIVILSGGEPMLREDLYELAARGTELGLRMVMATCGGEITPGAVRELLAAGIRRISLSLDGAGSKTHDSFRRVEGGFETVLRAAAYAREGGLEFQINTTITKLNYSELDKIMEKVKELGAVSFHPFLFVPTGRGKELTDYMLDASEYERILSRIHAHSLTGQFPIKPTCAPQYYRILHQQGSSPQRKTTRPLDRMSRGCLGGQGFAFLSHTGLVQICGFLEEKAGDIRKENFDFGKIWQTAPLFLKLRDKTSYSGRCGICEYWHICGGCRARASAINGDPFAPEPFCLYEPRTGSVKA